MLENGREIALKIVLPDEDAEKIRIAQGAEDVPGQRRRAKRCDDQGVQETKWRAPLAGEGYPQQGCSPSENHSGWTFCQPGGAEKKSESDPENRSRPGLLQDFDGHGHRSGEQSRK